MHLAFLLLGHLYDASKATFKQSHLLEESEPVRNWCHIVSRTYQLIQSFHTVSVSPSENTIRHFHSMGPTTLLLYMVNYHSGKS